MLKGLFVIGKISLENVEFYNSELERYYELYQVLYKGKPYIMGKNSFNSGYEEYALYSEEFDIFIGGVKLSYKTCWGCNKLYHIDAFSSNSSKRENCCHCSNTEVFEALNSTNGGLISLFDSLREVSTEVSDEIDVLANMCNR